MARRPPDPNEPVLTPAMRRHLVERRIVEAMDRGEFDHLPGAGKPLAIDQPSVVNGDVWWALRLMRQANVVPDEVRYRKRIDELRREVDVATDDEDVRRAVRELNGLILKLNGMGTNAIPTSLTTFDENEVLARWRHRRQGAETEGPSHASVDT